MEVERAPRRTQAERREGTRRALLEATIESLVAIGYARTTTTEVVRRAGLSQGALFKHFPTKTALVAAAAEQLFDDLILTFEHAFASSTEVEHEPAIVVALRRLWDIFRTDEMLAVYRLYAEAPNEPELHAALEPVVKSHYDNLVRLAASLFPETASSPMHNALFSGVVFAMQGATLQRPVYVDEARERQMLVQLETLSRVLFPNDGGRT